MFRFAYRKDGFSLNMKINWALAFTALFMGSLIIAVLTACSSEDTTTQLSAGDRFALGMEEYNDEDYLSAMDHFRAVTLQYPGSAVADDAQFYLAECRFKREEFLLAAYEYEVLIRTMPTSEYASRARYARALCYYNLAPKPSLDQEYTRQAIDEFQAFIEYSPTDSLVPSAEQMIQELVERLAEKEYNTGLLYLRMEYYRAAVISFDHVLEKYHDTQYAEPALLRKSEALYYRKRYSEAQSAVEQFLNRYPSSGLREAAVKLKEEILKANG